MSEKVKTVASLQSQVSRLEDSSQEVHTQLSNLSVRLREEQQKVQLAQEETQTLRSKITIKFFGNFILIWIFNKFSLIQFLCSAE